MYNYKYSKDEGDTPPFWYAVFRGVLDGTQYAKGWYAVHRFCYIVRRHRFLR